MKWHYQPHAPVEENFEQWVTNRFGRRHEIFSRCTEKVWGILHGNPPSGRPNAFRAFARSKSFSTRQRSTSGWIRSSPIHAFQYPRLGPGQMWETCRDRVVERGHPVLLQHKVDRFDVSGGRVTAVHAQTPNGPQIFEAEHVISTMPIRSLVRAISPAGPDRIREAAEGLRYRDFLVALILKKDRLFPDNWIYIHTPGVQ